MSHRKSGLHRLPRLRLLPRSRRLRLAVLALGFLSLVPLVPAALHNFHPVLAGRVYRSAQVSPGDLERYVARYGLRSIVNLRGANPGDDWYDGEREAAARMGVALFDLPIDSVSPTPEEMRTLVRTLQGCPKPVCLHCNSGIDRTGIAAAVAVLLLDDGADPDAALDQFSLWYGHSPFGRNLVRQESFIRDYETWLRRAGLRHRAGVFADWASHMPPDRTPPSPRS